MTTIPSDIQKTAERVYAQLGRGVDADEQAIAKALMAEREASAAHCDVIAERYANVSPSAPLYSGGAMGAEECARKIRRDTPASIRSPQPSPPAGA